MPRMSGNITRQGITADLEAMAESGIGGAWIFNLGESHGCEVPPGPIDYMSDEWMEMDHDKERFQPAWEKTRYIENGIKDLPGLKNARMEYYPKSGKGTGYHTIGLKIMLDDLNVPETNKLIRKMREGDPEVWVRNWGKSNDFIINAINLQPGDEKAIVKRFKELFG